MRPPDVALAHYSDRAKLVSAAAEVAGQMWAEVDPNRIVESWTAQVPELTAVLTGAQLGAARPADRYLDDVASLDDLPSEASASVDPGGFAGTASDGRSLLELLMSPGFTALQIIGAGLLHPGQAVASAGGHLDTIVRTQVADAGRLADQTALVAHKEYGGYVRIVVGATCSRCLLLAGRWYAYNAAFQRHPRCDCTQLPANIAKAANFVQNPQAIYDRMTQTQRTKAGWTLGDQRAIGEGADLFAVTNAHRGVYTAGGRKFTREGTTRRGTFGGYKVDPETGKLVRRPRGEKPGPRLTPDQIFAEAATRDDAVRMLADNGYLRELPAQLRRPTIQLPSAAAEAVDPALKMTVAHLKAIAKDNGVQLYGVTKKHDIISEIRQWEQDKQKSGGKILIPDGPIGKRISFKPPAIEAPPLGVPSTTGKVLSGSSLNDWVDYFKYDQQYARHEFVDTAGNTAAEGVRVKDLRTNIGSVTEGIAEYVVPTGTAWSFDGVAYLIEHDAADFGAPWVSRALQDLQAAHEAIPAAKMANRSYAVLARNNPADGYWQRRFNNPLHRSVASAGDGDINIWAFHPVDRIDVGSLRHETGHNLDARALRQISGSDSPVWLAAVDADAGRAATIADLTPAAGRSLRPAVDASRGFPKGVTRYGQSSAAEDYAESVMLYQLGPIATGRIPGVAIPELVGVRLPAGVRVITDAEILYFRDIYPARAKLLDKVFPDIAKAQKAEIKALRSAESPANVAKREAAKVRQVAIDTATTKAQALADLDELVGKGASPKLIADNLDVLAQTKALAAVDLSALRRVVATGDRTKIAATVDRITGKYKLTGVAKAGDITTMREGFDVVGGKALAPGTEVRIVRRGTEVVHNGETIVLSRPQVRAVTKAELAAIRDKAIAEARAVVDAATKPLTAVQLKKAGLTKVAGPKGVTGFDPAKYELADGSVLPAGTAVKVVKPGYSLTYRGEVVELRKPVVEVTFRSRESKLLGDLLSLSPVTRAREVRKALEGEWAGGIRVKVDLVKADKTMFGQPQITMHAILRDRTGREVGTMHGDFYRERGRRVDPDRLVANHDYINIDPSLQGSGFSNEFMANLFDWYTRSGVSRVEVFANIDVGGYAWAAQGFDFVDEQARRALASIAETQVARIRGQIANPPPLMMTSSGPYSILQHALKGMTEREFLAQAVEFDAVMARIVSGEAVSAYEISQLGRKAGQGGKDAMWLGKWILLGSSWRGQILL